MFVICLTNCKSQLCDYWYVSQRNNEWPSSEEIFLVFSLRCYFFSLFTNSVNWWTALCLHFIFWGIFSQISRRAVVRFFPLFCEHFSISEFCQTDAWHIFWNRKWKCRKKDDNLRFKIFRHPLMQHMFTQNFVWIWISKTKKVDREKHQLDEEAIFRKWKCWVLREFLLFVVVFVCFRLKSESVTCVNGLHSCDGQTDGQCCW